MIEYFWVITIETTLPEGRASSYSSGTLTAQPPATRQDIFRTALAKVKADAGLPLDADVEVKYFYLEPNALPVAEAHPSSKWPECMCTPSGECGNCWEKRQQRTEGTT